MKNKNKMITANEINKYLYCPYQWYYERYYGIEHIRNLYKNRNELLGLKDKTKSNFVKGQKFHNEYPIKEQKNRLWILLVAAIAVLIFFVYFYFLK